MRTDKNKSRFKDYLPACVKCNHYQPSGNADPFDDEAQCALCGDIPPKYLLMDEACNQLDVNDERAFIDVGDRPLTMRERWAQDNIQLNRGIQP
jgi:hypothetical protein